MTAIIDTTLREGEQTPGIRFSLTQKRQILDGLVKIGIGEAELGIASPLVDCPAHLLSYVRQTHPSLAVSLWSRCMEEDIRYAATLKPDILSLSLPVSDILLQDKLEKDREWIADCLQKSISLTRDLGMKAAIGFEDATRAEPDFLRQMAQLAEKSGAWRIRLADTIGTASPLEMAALVSTISSAASRCHIAVHCHNDLGMATANAVSALESGADYADATVLGLGERCGCARLEELVGFLKLKKGLSFNIGAVPALSKYIAKITACEIPGNQPFIGNQIFTCETGLHLPALQKNPSTYEPYPPELVGSQRNLLFGPQAGRKTILSHLQSMGHPVSDTIDLETARAIRNSLAEGKTSIGHLVRQLNR